MIESFTSDPPLVIGGPLAGHATIVLLIIGGLVVVLGVLRLLGILPRLALIKIGGGNRNPVVDGIAMLILGAAMLIFAIFLRR